LTAEEAREEIPSQACFLRWLLLDDFPLDLIGEHAVLAAVVTSDLYMYNVSSNVVGAVDVWSSARVGFQFLNVATDT
jgi:hypothetical protein